MRAIPKPEHPRPDLMRGHWLNLNGTWDFRLFPAGEEAAEADFAARRGDYGGKITVPFSWADALSGVGRDEPGTGWYARRARFDAKGRVFLCFGAVDYACEAYVNGRRIGTHRGGYAPFAFDVADFWRPGEENLIEVRARDARRPCQTTGKQLYAEIAGIWQTVWLEERPAAWLENLFFETRCDGTVILRAGVEAGAAGAARLEAAFAGRTFARDCALECGRNEVELRFRVENPRLWSTEDPYLYEGTVALFSECGEDRVRSYFGIREIAARCFGGREFPWITLNGRPVSLCGALDQAVYARGGFTAEDERVFEDEAWRMKRLGLNLVRFHIKPEEPRMLYHMDKAGIMVMEDMPCFWGEPDGEARGAYEDEMREVMLRDRSHPSIISFVLFNETWGLFHFEGGQKTYRAETQDWVRRMYARAKRLDPTRLIEDNSACNYDHVQTDLNTWHFYMNGYQPLREHVARVVRETWAGSAFNYTGGARQGREPLMVSECGMVWGVEGSAGDSDIAWQYRYMLNEFRLHEKLCGFVFTEFRDVANEFNGYYRVDGRDKDFGYGDLCRGMTLRDLHAQDFVAVDAPPCQTVRAGETVLVPLVLSSFSGRGGASARIAWALWYDSPDGRITADWGERPIDAFGLGVTCLEPLALTMPDADAAAVCSIWLLDDRGHAISRNFTAFDVRRPARDPRLLPLGGPADDRFPVSWTAMDGEKLCFGGSGEVWFRVDLPGGACPDGLELLAEAGAKRVLAKDAREAVEALDPLRFFRDPKSLTDRGAFPNSYFMTDEAPYPSAVEVFAGGERIGCFSLPNDPADARGILSWHAQKDDRRLDEAGSYGYLIRAPLPSRIVPALWRAGAVDIVLRVSGGGGLALYGRHSGRYALAPSIRMT